MQHVSLSEIFAIKGCERKDLEVKKVPQLNVNTLIREPILHFNGAGDLSYLSPFLMYSDLKYV